MRPGILATLLALSIGGCSPNSTLAPYPPHNLPMSTEADRAQPGASYPGREPRSRSISGEPDPGNAVSFPRSGESISLAELRTQIRVVRNYRRKDEFDVGPQTSTIVGKSFEIEITPKPDRSFGCSGQPVWWFRAEESTFFVALPTSNLYEYYTSRSFQSVQDEAGRSQRVRFVSFDCHQAAGAPYAASNSFGVSRMVRVQRESLSAVSYNTFNRDCSSACIWRARLPPDRARALSGDVRVRVRGHIGRWNSGRAIICGESKDSPTLSNPVERQSRGCFVRAHIDSISIVGLEIR